MAPTNPPPEVFAYAVGPSLQSWNVSPKTWMAQHDKHWDGLAVATVVFDKKGRVLLVQRAAHDSMPSRWEVPGGAADQEDDESQGDDKDQDDKGKDKAAGGGGKSSDSGNSGVGGSSGLNSDGGSAGASARQQATKNSILHAAARELWEESGLIAQRFTHLIPQPTAPSSPGTLRATALPADGPVAPVPDHPGQVFTNRTGLRVFCRFAFHAVVRSTEPVVLDANEHQDYVWATEGEVRAERLDSADKRPIPITTPATKEMILEAFRLREAEK